MRILERPGQLAAAILVVLGVATLALAGPGAGHDDDAKETKATKTKAEEIDTSEHGPQVTRLVMPIMNSAKGMEVFINKGCYTCHSVNGVGGEDASPLDAHGMDPYMNPFDMAAKMWLMAPIMIPAQEEAMGEQITFTGVELADIIAFLHDDEQQHKFVEGILTEEQLAAIEHGHPGQSDEEDHAEEPAHD